MLSKNMRTRYKFDYYFIFLFRQTENPILIKALYCPYQLFR